MKKELIKILPKLEDLVNDVVDFNENQQLAAFLNQEPPSAWLLAHPFLKVPKKGGKFEPMLYLSIERTEFLLNSIMIEWSIEVISSTLVANSILTVVRLHHTLPTGRKTWHDGVGAAPLQIDAGAGAIDFNKMKQAAVQMAAPASKSFAIKDAAHHIGKIFGKDLNRENFAQSSVTIVGDDDEPTNAFDKALLLTQQAAITPENDTGKTLSDAIEKITDNTDLSILFSFSKKEITGSDNLKYRYLCKLVQLAQTKSELTIIYNENKEMYDSLENFGIKQVFSNRKIELS